MEDVGIPIHNECLLKQVRVRDEVNGDNRDDEKRQKTDELDQGEEEVISTTPKGGVGVDVGGGLIDSLLAKLTSPRGASDGSESKVFKDDVEGETEGGVGGGGGGVINDIISGLFSKGENGGKNDEGKKVNEGEGVKKDDGLENGSGKINGGSIIANLVPDEVAPPADEASILIHSVVHD